MRPNKEISEALKRVKNDINKTAIRMEQEGAHAPYSPYIENHSLHDSMTALVSKKLTLEWVLLKKHS